MLLMSIKKMQKIDGFRQESITRNGLLFPGNKF